MKIDAILTVIFALLILGLMGAMDRQDELAAAAHKRETIAAAKEEFKRRQTEERFGDLYREAERMTFPIAASRNAER